MPFPDQKTLRYPEPIPRSLLRLQWTIKTLTEVGVGGMIAVTRQAEKLLGLRTFAAGLEAEEKERLPDEVSKPTAMYVVLMDSPVREIHGCFNLDKKKDDP